MRHFRWSKENEVFLPQIDAEHRNLFRLAEEFENAIAQRAPAEEIKEQLRALRVYTEEHFTHEEWLMQSSGYPSYGWHKQQHETVRRRLKLFTPPVESGDREAVEVFLEFLAGWLHDHTTVTDRMMGAFVRNYDRAHAVATEKSGDSNGGTRAAPARQGPFPRTILYCRLCSDHTRHEMRPTGMVCLTCAERSVRAELDRE